MLLSSKLGPMKLGVVVVMVLVPALAAAQDRPDLDGEKEMERTLAHPTPVTGLERAHVGPPRWCGRLKERDEQWAGTFVNEMQDYRGNHFSQYRLFNAAHLVCNQPNRPAAQHAAAEVLQYWINETGLSEQDAIASLAARFDEDAWSAAHDQLCSALGDNDSDDSDDRDGGDEGDDDDDDGGRAKRHRNAPHHVRGAGKLAHAHRVLLGCTGGDPQWLQKRGDAADDLAPYVDRGPVLQDALARTSWVMARTERALDPAWSSDHRLVAYALDQFTLHSVTTDQLMHALDTAPLKGNLYARAIVLETTGALKLDIARYDAAVAAKISDPLWKHVLVNAPQRGAADWQAAADKHKDALAHSDAFAESHSKGCAKQLWSDFLPIVKPFKHDSVEALYESISGDPLAGLLLQRLIECLVVDGEHGPASTLEWLGDSVRIQSGPMMAAYYATLDAVTDLGDRTKISAVDVPYLTEPKQGRPDRIDEANIFGVMASVTKTAKGVHVVFVQQRIQTMSQKCVETNKPDRVTSDGRIIYRQACHDTGMVWVNTNPDPVDVPAQYAGGLKAGRYAKFDDTNMPEHGAIPKSVFSDKVGKHMIAWGGILFE
jgi:hypothetical protein